MKATGGLGGADQRAALLALLPEDSRQLRNAKVRQLDGSLRVQQQVRGLHVAVDNVCHEVLASSVWLYPLSCRLGTMQQVTLWCLRTVAMNMLQCTSQLGS